MFRLRGMRCLPGDVATGGIEWDEIDRESKATQGDQRRLITGVKDLRVHGGASKVGAPIKPRFKSRKRRKR
jgi:hypothetical protein